MVSTHTLTADSSDIVQYTYAKESQGLFALYHTPGVAIDVLAGEYVRSADGSVSPTLSIWMIKLAASGNIVLVKYKDPEVFFVPVSGFDQAYTFLDQQVLRNSRQQGPTAEYINLAGNTRFSYGVIDQNREGLPTRNT